MNGLLGRTRRFLAGLISAMMVLTSLPLTGVAVYAAPSGNVVEDVAYDVAQEAVADDAGETAVADEASEPAAADEAGEVTLTFTRSSEWKEHIIAVSVNGVEKRFEGEDPVRFSVSPNVPCTFRIRKDDSDPQYASDFVFADWGDRNYEDSCQFTFTPTHDVQIICKHHWFKIMQDDVTKAVFSSGTVLSGLDCVKDPIEDINFTLSGVSENYVYCEVTAETLPVSESHGTYTISANALKNFVFNSTSDTIIELRVNGTKYEASRIIPPSNTGEVKYTVVESSLVKFGDVSYAKRDTDYRFKVEPAPALTAAGRDISRVTYTIGDGEPETVTADGEGIYSIPAADIVAAAKADQDIKIGAVAGQELNIKVAGNVSGITYGENGDENPVSMADARSVSGASVSVDPNKVQKMAVTVSDDSLLLSDSVTVNGKPVSAADGKYTLTSDEPKIDVAVKAYRKVTVSSNELKTSDGKKDFTKIEITDGVSGNGLTTGDAISFDYGYADGVTDFDVDLAAPEVYYMTGNSKTTIAPQAPHGGDIEGTYSISREYVEAAIKAGSDIHIVAKGQVIEKVTVSFTVPDDVDFIEYSEYSPVKKMFIRRDKSVSVDAVWTSAEGKKTTEIEIQKGNNFYLTGFDDNGIDFYRVMLGTKELDGGIDGFSAGALTGDTAIRLEGARLKKTDLKFVVEGNTETVSLNLAIADKFFDGEYLKNEISPTITQTDNGGLDPIYRYKLGDLKYEVTGGSKGKLMYLRGDVSLGVDPGYYIPMKTLIEAAFSSDTSPKITIYAKQVVAETRPQLLELFCLSYTDTQNIQIVQSGATNPFSDSAVLKYGEPVAVTLKSKAGFNIDKVFLVKNTDITIERDGNYPQKLREMLTASDNTIPVKVYKPGKDGSVKITIPRMDGNYTLVDSATATTDVVVMDEGKRILPDKYGVYNISWYDMVKLSLKNGSEALKISGNSVSANVGAADVTNKFVVTKDLKYLKFLGYDDAVNDKVVTLKFVLEDSGETKTLKFKSARKPSIKFAEGSVSSNGFTNIINEELPLGTARTFDIKVDGDVSDLRASISYSDYLTSGAAGVSLVPVKNKAGKVTGYKMTVSSRPISGLTLATITFRDKRTDRWQPQYKVLFNKDQVVKTDLSGIKVTGLNDALAFDFSNVRGIDKTTEGLYYMVSVSADDATTPVYLKERAEEYFSADTTTATLNLLKDSTNADENVEPSAITYGVTVKLVQMPIAGSDPVAESEKAFENNAETKANTDGIYATKIKLKKVKSAGTLYGGGKDGAKWTGMDTTLIATVAYPNVGRKAVTEKRLKKVELLSNGLPVTNSGSFIQEENGNIYLRTVNGSDILYPGKYTVVAYAVQPKGKDVTATMNITLANPIFNMSMTTAGTYYKRPNKAAVISPNVEFNYGMKEFAPKSKKVKWSVVDNGGNPLTLPAGWSFKNGKVTIAKKTTIPRAGVKFKIKAEAADFDHGSNGVETLSVQITVLPVSKAPQPDGIFINGFFVEPGSYLSGYLDGGLVVVDQAGNPMSNVSIKTTGVLKKQKNENPAEPEWEILTLKPGKGTIKVTTTDGSGYSKTFKYTVQPDDGINGMIADVNQGWNPNGTKDWKLRFDNTRSEYYVTNTNPSDQQDVQMLAMGYSTSIINHSLKLTGFKKVKTSQYGMLQNGEYVLRPTARNATIKITNKKTKESVTIHVTNECVPEKGASTATVTGKNMVVTTFGKAAVNKKGVVYTLVNYGTKAAYDKVSFNHVTYTVKYGKSTAASAGEKVRLHLVNASKNVMDPGFEVIENAIAASGGVSNGDGTYTMTLGEGGTFCINYIDSDGKFMVNPGTYKIQVLPVDDEGNPTHKPCTIKLKAVTTPKPVVKVSSKVTFTSTVSGASVNLIPTKQANIAVFNGTESSFAVGKIEGNFDVRGVNVGGKINAFSKMFKVENGKLVYTGEKDPTYNSKTGISGVVAVNYTTLDGYPAQVFVPVTVRGDF